MPMEKKFGTLVPGMACGESMMLDGFKGERFYSAIALTTSVVLTLSMSDYLSAI